jgi:hypothetical protein
MLMEAGILKLLFYIMSLFIFYFVIKLAVKNAFREKEEDIRSLIKETTLTALKEHEYNKENR